MAFNNRIFLIDVDQVLDKQTGKNKYQITRKTEVYADRQEVGLEEYTSALASKNVLVASYEIPEYTYHGEKYLASSDGKLQFEIYRVGKGRNPGYLRLPVRAVTNKLVLEGMKNG